MNYASKGIIDASCYGAFKRSSAEEEKQPIKTYDAPSPGGPNEHSQPTENCVSHIMRPIHV